MTNTVWLNIISHLFVLCGIRQMDSLQHEAYLLSMFKELKDKFNDKDIGFAARQIAEKENLYGSYPPLSLWLKYCPQKRAEQIDYENKLLQFMNCIDHIMACDGFYFDIENTEKEIYSHGDTAINTINQFGGVSGIRRRGYNASQFVKENLYKDIKKSWEESNIDIVSGALLLINKDDKFIENKKD